MINLLKSIVDGIKTLFDFLIHTFESLLNIISSIPRFITYIYTLIDYVVPDLIKPFLYLGITVSVILFLINRRK